MIQGEENPEVLSELAQRRMKAKKSQIMRALHGLIREYQKQMLAAQLRHIDFFGRKATPIG